MEQKKMDKITDYIKSYSYLVEFSTEDDAYLSHCRELGITAHGDSQETAISAIKEATRVHLLMLAEDREDIPHPISENKTKSLI
jgi:predicted RNase H-like HicB family nuclease